MHSPVSNIIYRLTFLRPFGAVSRSCLRGCLLGCGPHTAPNKTSLSRGAFFLKSSQPFPNPGRVPSTTPGLVRGSLSRYSCEASVTPHPTEQEGGHQAPRSLSVPGSLGRRWYRQHLGRPGRGPQRQQSGQQALPAAAPGASAAGSRLPRLLG